jgi:hypothetical protein
VEHKEVILPSGAFAKIRSLTWGDRILANIGAAASGGGEMYLAHLVARVATIDGEAVTVEQALELDLRDADALITALLPYITGPVRSATSVVPPNSSSTPEGNGGV